jgi:hypothetical protein
MAKAPARPAAAPKSAFQQAAAKSAAAFQAARQAERKLSGGFQLPDIADGEYEVEIQEVVCEVGTGAVEGKPVIRMKGVVINSPEYDGVQLDTFDVIAESQYNSEEEAWEKALNRFYSIGYELAGEVSLADVEATAAAATSEKPQVLARVKNGKKQSGDRKVTVSWLGLLDSGEESEEVDYEGGEEAGEEAPPPAPAKPAKKSAPKGRK